MVEIDPKNKKYLIASLAIVCLAVGSLAFAWFQSKITAADPGLGPYRLIDLKTRGDLRGPARGETTLVIDALGFPPEGEGCDSTLLCDAFLKGWRRFITFDLHNHPFAEYIMNDFITLGE